MVTVLFYHYFFSAVFLCSFLGKLKLFLPWKVRQFSKVSDISRKSQTVLGTFKPFLEVWNNSRKSQIVLGTLRQFSEVSKQFSEVPDSSRKTQTMLENPKQFSLVSKSSRESQTVLGSSNNSWISGHYGRFRRLSQ